MAIFKKKEMDEEEYEDDEKIRGRRRKSLNKKSARKKKELTKPWGKKERILVFAILLITVGISGILYMSSRAWKLPGLPQLKLPEISFPFSGTETIVIEGDNTLDVQESSEEIIPDFNQKTKILTGVYGLYVVDLKTGYSFGVNTAEKFEPASLNKLPVMAAMFAESEKGNINLNEYYSLKDEDKAAGAGSLNGRPSGYEITYRNLLKLMGKQSDNTAFNITRSFLGDEKIEAMIKKIGMRNTSVSENTTTPADIGVYFEELYNGNIINEESRNELLGYLTDTLYEAWLSEGVPEGVRVAHKYGRETNVVNDAGIVYLENPYVIVILSKGVIVSEADKVFPDISHMVYEKISD